jgi:hypothetical protein
VVLKNRGRFTNSISMNLVNNSIYHKASPALFPLVIHFLSYFLAYDDLGIPSNEMTGSGRHMQAISTPFL